MDHKEFLVKCKQAAMNIGMSWPGYVAAEAALESRYGQSQLAIQASNLFGMKAHRDTIPEMEISFPTKEYISGEWIAVPAHWMRYSDWEACLRDRQATLARLTTMYPHYQAALDASDGETFIREVSQTWSTDPHRADKVLEIYSENLDILG